MDAPAPNYFEAWKERVTDLMNRLNNQVTVSSGYVQFLKESKPRLTPEQKQWLETIDSSSDKAAALVKELHAALLG